MTNDSTCWRWRKFATRVSGTGSTRWSQPTGGWVLASSAVAVSSDANREPWLKDTGAVGVTTEDSISHWCNGQRRRLAQRGRPPVQIHPDLCGEATNATCCQRSHPYRRDPPTNRSSRGPRLKRRPIRSDPLGSGHSGRDVPAVGAEAEVAASTTICCPGMPDV